MHQHLIDSILVLLSIASLVVNAINVKTVVSPTNDAAAKPPYHSLTSASHRMAPRIANVDASATAFANTSLTTLSISQESHSV